jgi:hypothetical protein
MPLAAMLGASLMLASSVRAESNLLQNSPFLPPDGGTRSAQQAAPLELRSIVVEGGQYEFSLYDPARRQSTWVRLNEPNQEFTITAFDAMSDTVTVETRDRVFKLELKEAKIPMTLATPAISVSDPKLMVLNGGTQSGPNTLTPEQILKIEELRKRKRERESILPASREE